MSSVADPPAATLLHDPAWLGSRVAAMPAGRFAMTLWTDDPVLAARADSAGVDRVGVDLETIGKAERQSGLNTWISTHSAERVPAIRRSLRRAKLFARVNPPGPWTAGEVELLLGRGVDVLMLPMFETAAQLAAFIEIVGGRAGVVALLETSSALSAIECIVALEGLTEIHVGINDLALALGLGNRFELLESPELERLAGEVVSAGLRLGIGGIGRLDDLGVPIPPDLIYAQYARLGASAALLSRGYVAGVRARADLRREIGRSRRRIAFWQSAGAERMARARREFDEALLRASGW